MKRIILAVSLLGSLAACANSGQPGTPFITPTTETISNATNPIGDLARSVLPADLQAQATLDLQTTAANFDAAATLTPALPGMALYSSCVHLINQQLGIEATPDEAIVQTVTLTNNGVFSLGSEVVIDAERLSQLASQGIQVPQNCVLAFGTLNLQALGKLFSGLPGGLPINIIPNATPAQIHKMRVRSVQSIKERNETRQ